MVLSRNELPNFDDLTNVDGTILGRHNKVNSINPYRCRFVVTYPDGSEVNGVNLFNTGWDNIPNGLLKLRYELSTGHIIHIPRYKAYLPLIEVSYGMDGSRIFHFINVNCLADSHVVIYKIVLRQDNISPYKIGDVILSKQKIPSEVHSSWKYSS